MGHSGAGVCSPRQGVDGRPLGAAQAGTCLNRAVCYTRAVACCCTGCYWLCGSAGTTAYAESRSNANAGADVTVDLCFAALGTYSEYYSVYSFTSACALFLLAGAVLSSAHHLEYLLYNLALLFHQPFHATSICIVTPARWLCLHALAHSPRPAPCSAAPSPCRVSHVGIVYHLHGNAIALFPPAGSGLGPVRRPQVLLWRRCALHQHRGHPECQSGPAHLHAQ